MSKAKPVGHRTDASLVTPFSPASSHLKVFNHSYKFGSLGSSFENKFFTLLKFLTWLHHDNRLQWSNGSTHPLDDLCRDLQCWYREHHRRFVFWHGLLLILWRKDFIIFGSLVIMILLAREIESSGWLFINSIAKGSIEYCRLESKKCHELFH